MNKQAVRLKIAVEAKRIELIELFKSMGHGPEVENMNITELQELMKKGIRK